MVLSCWSQEVFWPAPVLRRVRLISSVLVRRLRPVRSEHLGPAGPFQDRKVRLIKTFYLFPGPLGSIRTSPAQISVSGPNRTFSLTPEQNHENKTCFSASEVKLKLVTEGLNNFHSFIFSCSKNDLVCKITDSWKNIKIWKQNCKYLATKWTLYVKMSRFISESCWCCYLFKI